MGWLARLFDPRDTLLRWLLLDLSGISYLVSNAHHPLPVAQLGLAVVAFGTALVCHRWRLVNLLAQTALLALAIWLLDDLMINQVGASWALLELALWAPRLRTVWWGAGVLAVVRLFDAVG